MFVRFLGNRDDDACSLTCQKQNPSFVFRHGSMSIVPVICNEGKREKERDKFKRHDIDHKRTIREQRARAKGKSAK